jgi:hypothetical protein
LAELALERELLSDDSDESDAMLALVENEHPVEATSAKTSRLRAAVAEPRHCIGVLLLGARRSVRSKPRHDDDALCRRCASSLYKSA